MTSKRAGGLALLWASLPHPRRLWRVAGWSALESSPALLSGLAVGNAVDGLRTGHSAAAVAWLAALLAAIVVNGAATRGLYGAVAPVVEDVRDGLTAAVTRGSLARLAESGRSGTVPLTQAIDQVDQVRNILSALLRSLRSTLAPLVAAAVGLTALAPALGAAVAIPLVIGFAGYAALLPRTVRAHTLSAKADEQLGEDAAAVVAGAEALRGLGAAQWGVDRINGVVEAARSRDVRLTRTLASRHIVLALGSYLPLVALLCVAGPLLSHGEISAGQLVGAATYVLTVLAPALSATVSGAGGWFVQLAVLLDRLSLVAAVPDPVPVRQPIDTGAERAVLVARDLGFAYRPGARPVIDGLNLVVQPEQLVAVVGPSGAGKSTLAYLVAGMLQPSAGHVGLAPGRSLALVPQRPYVFRATVRENLTCLAPNTPAAEAFEECVAAFGLGPLVKRLGGLDAMIPTGAGALSEAERQRIVLARTHLSRADVLVLDEATSHLDPADEARIEQWLRARHRALVVVAHRLDVTARATQVVFFDGADVHVGSHRDLLRRCGDYRELAAYAAAC